MAAAVPSSEPWPDWMLYVITRSDRSRAPATLPLETQPRTSNGAKLSIARRLKAMDRGVEAVGGAEGSDEACDDDHSARNVTVGDGEHQSDRRPATATLGPCPTASTLLRKPFSMEDGS